MVLADLFARTKMTSRTSYLLLAAGGIGGVLFAIGQIATTKTSESLGDHAAVVNGQPIQNQDYQRALSAVQSDGKGSPLTVEDRKRILTKLIDEELLMQHAESLRLQRRDPQVRAILVRQVIDAIVQEASLKGPPDEKTLRDYHEQEPGRYRMPLRLRVQHSYFKGKDTDTLQRATKASAAAGPSDKGDPFALSIDDSWVPPSLIRQRLGSEIATAVGSLAEGERSSPLPSTHGYHVLKLIGRRGGEGLAFDDVRESVLSDFLRERDEQALRKFLKRQRDRAEIKKSAP